jgi:hypothetical protein
MSRMMASSCTFAAPISSVCAASFSCVIGHGDHSSVPTRKYGGGTGGRVNNSVDGLM